MSNSLKEDRFINDLTALESRQANELKLEMSKQADFEKIKNRH